jgi:hypothetical protein
MPSKPMKLAEALLLRADLQTKLVRLQERICDSAVVQHGDKPREDSEKLLREAVGVLGELQSLVTRINTSNLRVILGDGRTLTEAMAERDRLKKHHSLLLAAEAASRRTPDRHGLSEIKWVPQLDSTKLQKQAEDISVKIRQINSLIQGANWKASLES